MGSRKTAVMISALLLNCSRLNSRTPGAQTPW
jgi:hypothetical protein